MICPTCHNVMIVVEHKDIELDYCPECSGAWFDSGELELMMESMKLEDSGLSTTDILAHTEAATAEKKRKCPICNRKMKKVNIGHPGVLIDACSGGDGLWFDGGEVHQMIDQFARKISTETGGENNIISFLGETFQAEKQQDRD